MWRWSGEQDPGNGPRETPTEEDTAREGRIARDRSRQAEEGAIRGQSSRFVERKGAVGGVERC